MEYRALSAEYRAVLMEYRALSVEYRAVLMDYRALSVEYFDGIQGSFGRI